MSLMKKLVLSVLVFALSVAFAMPTMAQDAGSARGNLSGLVYDSSQSLVPGAEVTITGPTGSSTQNTTGQGSFIFSTLYPAFTRLRLPRPDSRSRKRATSKFWSTRPRAFRSLWSPAQLPRPLKSRRIPSPWIPAAAQLTRTWPTLSTRTFRFSAASPTCSTWRPARFRVVSPATRTPRFPAVRASKTCTLLTA